MYQINLAAGQAQNSISYVLGQILRAIRKKRNLTQKDVASKVGKSTAHINKAENGLLPPNETFAIILKIA